MVNCFYDWATCPPIVERIGEIDNMSFLGFAWKWVIRPSYAHLIGNMMPNQWMESVAYGSIPYFHTNPFSKLLSEANCSRKDRAKPTWRRREVQSPRASCHPTRRSADDALPKPARKKKDGGQMRTRSRQEVCINLLCNCKPWRFQIHYLKIQKGFCLQWASNSVSVCRKFQRPKLTSTLRHVEARISNTSVDPTNCHIFSVTLSYS